MAEGGRRLRNVRIRQAIRAFERLGYEVTRVRGSRYILQHQHRGLLVLPFHQGTMKFGILMDALDKAGISVEEFQALM